MSKILESFASYKQTTSGSVATATAIITKGMLRKCASSGKGFYDATNSATLLKAFGEIGSGLNDVGLIR